MNNEELKIIIGQAISNVIAKTKNEYANLNQIYDEVSNIIGENIDETVKTLILSLLQENCSQYSDLSLQYDYYRTKEKNSGLWKNKITGETELTPYIKTIIKQYPGIDIVVLKSKLYELVDLTPGDRAISLTRPGEKKIDQIMRNFVSHKDSHRDIKFEKKDRTYKMYYVGDDETIDDDLYKKFIDDDMVLDIIFEENEKPEENIENVKIKFISDELTPRKTKNVVNNVFIRKNDIKTWIKREESRIKNGNISESLIFEAEKLKLHELNRDDLVEKVKWMSRDSGDGYGYDILSYDLDENNREYEIYIEVKSTPNLNDDFIMSANELQFAKDNIESYRLYRVANLKTGNPICKVIKGNLDDIFKFKTNEFKLSVKSDN